MGRYNGAVLTTAGQQIISSAIAGSQTVQWTAIKTSSAVIPSGTNLEALTNLDGIEQSNDITSAQVYGETVIQVSGRISNLNVSTAYLVQAIGLYGKLEGGQETLMAVSTAVTPDQVPVYDEDSPAAFIYNVQITVQNASQVTMTVNDAGTATVADLNRKVDLYAGDLSETVIESATASTADYPVPSTWDSMSVVLGKLIKFCADIVKTYEGSSASTAGKKGLVPAPSAGLQNYYFRGDGTWQAPVNNATTTTVGRVLDARMGKTLQDQITDQLNSKKIRYYSVQLSVTANGYADVTANVSSDFSSVDAVFVCPTSAYSATTFSLIDAVPSTLKFRIYNLGAAFTSRSFRYIVYGN